MPGIWPAVPNIVLKILSCGLFSGSVFFEITDFQALRSVFNSSCIEGMEVTEEVGHHLLLLCMITIPDFVYAVTVFLAIPIRDCNFGSELTSIGYNIVSGMIAYSSLSKITMIENCGNEAMEVILFQPAASVSLSGTLHYANAFINFIFLAKAERSFYIMRTSDSNPDVFLQY